MSTVTLTNYDSEEIEDLQHFEKIRHREKALMPVHRSRSVISASHKTPSSRNVSRKISRSNGGKHRRRLRKFR